MATLTSSKALSLCALLLAAMLPVGTASTVHAQDAVGNTPPELRDFRLDPPPRETTQGPEVRTQPPQEAAPEPQRPVNPPTVETVPDPVIRPPIPASAEPERAAPAPFEDVTPDVSAEPDARVQLPEAPASTEVAPGDSDAPPKTETLDPPEVEGMGTAETVALAGLLLAIAGVAILMWRRRKVTHLVAKPQPRQTTSPPTPPRATTSPAPRRAPPAAPPPSPARAISMAFVPENAVVSFNSLTIKGQLNIANASKAEAQDLALDAVLISASNEQQRAIDGFFTHAGTRALTPLGSLNPGENMGLPLKLGVALNEMQTFSLQNKTLLAPILVAKLVRPSSDGTVQVVARLVCMIGRESTPPQPKMGPLRLDQGPRSFDRLGQRALLS